MKNCALYSSTFDLGQVEGMIRSIYPNAKMDVSGNGCRIQVKSGSWLNRKIKTFNIMTSKTHPEEFAAMLKEMENFFRQIPAENPKLHEKVLIKISTLQMVIGIESDSDISDAVRAELLRIIQELDGLMLWESSELLTPDGTLLLDTQGRMNADDYRVTAPSSFLHGELEDSVSGKSRKAHTEALLREQGIPVNEYLPALWGDEAAPGIRSQEETVRRAIALCITALKGECIGAGESLEDTRQLIQRVIGQYEADSFFSPKEQEFIGHEQPDATEAVGYSWGYEGFWVLLWALGHVDELGAPDQICDVAGAVSLLQQFDSYEAFAAASHLRSPDEILDAVDLIYRYDWICVDSRIREQPVPGGLDSGVVYERHRTLNWLAGYMGQDWDEVRTDT
ncbi:DUF4272 domain-containing protein [Paenibacillus sp. JX-17]|uniref:DUF4272 domain-containing protein n=1 Tax=Paenibacillus lacisoli TaxID=3064525 RepID=A0ABT9CGR9_9BACL|nr:DUF4272 domain-containing protein [Paenibacillus sp. JX-17]MDO7907778.1 DUF4272 domain-containing protein [Paenibacillus sp. JX-17]